MTDADFIAWLKKPSARRCVLLEVVASIGGVDTTLYLSNFSYISDGASTPANTAYTACVTDGVTFSASLDVVNNTPSISTGDIEIDNTGGVRDAWFGYVWAGRRVKVLMGDVQWVKSDFRVVFDGIVDDLDTKNAEVLNLRMRDKMARLNNPMTENLLGGVSDNKDRIIPLAFGECFNVTPLLIDPALLKYQVHDTSFEGHQIESFIEVRSNAAVPVSTTATLASGYFTLNVAPAGTDITASVQGGRNASNVYTNDISTVVQRIVTKYGPAGAGIRFTAGDLDATNLAAFATAHPAAIGLYAGDRMNVIDATQQLAASVGAQAYCTSAGLLRLVQIALPTAQTNVLGSTWAITSDDITYHTLQVAQRVPVQSAVKLGYCKNWTAQSNLAQGVNPISVPLFTEEWMTTTQTDSATATLYNQTVEPVEQDTLLVAASDATSEATRRLNLWKVQRHVYQMECRAHLLLAELGDPITVTHPRFGLSGGITGMVVSIDRDWLKGRVTLGVLA